MAFNRQPGLVNTVEDGVAALANLVNAPVDLTDEDEGTVDAEWDADAAAVVNNIRTRLGEIEAVLVTLGAVKIATDE